MPLHRNRFAALLAALALVLQGFLPLVAQARAAHEALYGPLCTADGPARAADLSGDGLPTDDGAGQHRKHCPLCTAGGDRTALLAPVAAAFFVSPAFAAEEPAAPSGARLRVSSASPAQPRAPPSGS